MDRRDVSWVGAIVVASILLRLPFWFPAVVDWDESTLVLMGQSVLDGRLPYLHLWDLKPPLAFLAYASFILALGESIVAIRLAGTLCVALVATLIYLCGRAIADRRSGGLAGILAVFALTVLPGGRATMTEHVALVPLTLALAVLFLQPSPRSRHAAVVGVLMASATLVRLNLAYPAVFVAICMAALPPRRLGVSLRRIGAYSAWFAVVVSLALLPHLLAGHARLWWSSVVVAPLAYARQGSVVDSLLGLAGRIATADDFPLVFGVVLLLWLGGTLGVAAAFRAWPWEDARFRSRAVVLAVFLVGVGLSIARSGVAHPHHLLQLHPFLALGAGMSFNRLPIGAAKAAAIAVAAVLLLPSLAPVLAEYRVLAGRWAADEPLRHGAAYEIADHLLRLGVDGSVYMMQDHIVYWLIDSRPPTRATTHPSNLTKPSVLAAIGDEGDSPAAAMANVLSKEPRFIVKQETVWYLESERAAEARRILEARLDADYQKVAEIRGRSVYERRPRRRGGRRRADAPPRA